MKLTPTQVLYADAALSLLARDGLAGVSYRTVAAVSGKSIGAVQKAFASKGEMLRAMFSRMREIASAPAIGEPGRPRLDEWLTDLSIQLLPLDEKRRTRADVAAAFEEVALTDRTIGEAIRAEDAETIERVASLVERAVREGEVRAVDPILVATLWLTLLEGWTQRLRLNPRPENEVRAEVRAALALLLRRAED